MKITIKKSDGWVFIGGGNTIFVQNNQDTSGIFVSDTKDDTRADYIKIGQEYELIKPTFIKTNSENGVGVSVVPTSGASVIINDVIPDVSASEFTDFFDVTVATSGDFITTSRCANGQQFTEVSIDPLAPSETQTIIEAKTPFQYPAYSEITASLSQRTKGDYAVMEITDKDMTFVDIPTEFNIVSMSQTTTTLTVTIDGVFDGWIGSWVDIYGLVDNRFSYTNLAVATISSNYKTLTFTTSDETTLPSLTASPASVAGGKLKRQAKLMSAANAVAMRFSGTSATSVSYMSRFDGSSIKEFGTLTGSRLVTCGSSAPTYTAGATGQVELKASTRYRIDLTPDAVFFSDRPIDTSSSVYTARVEATDVKPKQTKDYYVSFRAVNPISTSRPVAKIVSATKTASATATIVTASAHGLVTGNYVTIAGVRDQANFPNMAAGAAVTVINSTTFTVTIGSSATAASYGGGVSLANGQVVQQGLIAQTIQSVARDSIGIVTLVGSASWSGLGGVGEYVNIYGVRDASTGADLGFDGIYKVHNFSTTTLLLEPVKDATGASVFCGDGTLATPAGGVVSTTNCGGMVILRTTLRSHDFVCRKYAQMSVGIQGQGTNRIDLSIPTYSVGGYVSAVQGTAAAISSTTGLGGWYIHPAVTSITDIASAAITSTSTGASTSNNLGNGFQVAIPVTAVTGTAATLDVRIEQSHDGGTNWVTLYDFQRITATGYYISPLLRADARNIRYVQTVGGTSPSFTRSIVRNILPFHNADKLARLFDRTVSLTTLNAATASLFAGSATNAQIVVNIGAATTAPVFRLQGSDDNSNWYDLSATTLTAVANSTVQLTINNVNSVYIRGIVSTAGATVTAGYVMIKAWA